MISAKINSLIQNTLCINGDTIEIANELKLRSQVIDQLVWESVFGNDNDKALSRWIIWETALLLEIIPSSIHDLYIARGKEETPLDFTVPAINIRAITFDMARSVFRTSIRNNVKAMSFEIARSEIEYTDQRPMEYTCVLMAAAIKEGWHGPLFVQGDHFQAKTTSPGIPKEGEIQKIKELSKESIKAGFYNIDLDLSTLVDLNQPTEEEQQAPNIKYSLEIAKYIREVEPAGITISLGGEIGHIGGKNSTVKDCHAYMDGFNRQMNQAGMSQAGMSKISIQTGTDHGGVVLADGTLADIDIDFKVLSDISKVARSRYQMGGAVQHGASTLPDKYFKQFTKAEAVEVHLATGFFNLIIDHPLFPQELLANMYRYIKENYSHERKEGHTDAQFHYKLRKKAIGAFKKEMWSLSDEIRSSLRASLEKRFEFLFHELNVCNTTEIVSKFIKTVPIHKTLSDFTPQRSTSKDTRGLSD
ncbi:class II fructose-bisphosphate aldolase [Patescibacteria group bacterium]|nr:class II fructose-bisphosphate aldolase [Patescibacteria group bacterium]